MGFYGVLWRQRSLTFEKHICHYNYTSFYFYKTSIKSRQNLFEI